MAVRRIDRDLLMTDDGRFVFRAGGRAYHVPDDDIHRLDRRRTSVNVAAAGLLILSIGGIWLQLFSVWWLLPTVAVIAVLPLGLRRCVQENFIEIFGPAVIDDVDGVTGRLVPLEAGCVLLAMAQIILDQVHLNSSLMTLGLMLLTSAVTGIEFAQSRRGRDDREDVKRSEAASITR